MMTLAASVGWYASQNTYLERSLHSTELVSSVRPLKQMNGGKFPPQQGSYAFSNPESVITTLAYPYFGIRDSTFSISTLEKKNLTKLLIMAYDPHNDVEGICIHKYYAGP